MKIKQIIKKVFSVLQDSDGVYITNEKGFCEINEVLFKKGDYFNNSNGFVYEFDGEDTLIKIGDNFEKISTGYTSGCTIFSADSTICYKVKLKENRVDYLFNNQNQLINFNLDGRNVPINTSMNNIVFTDRKYQIFLYDLDNNNFLWHYTLPDGFKIFGSVQAIGDVLFFRITDKNLDNSKNVGLRIESGEVLWEIDDTTYFQIDYKKKLLRGYSGAYYQVMDPFEGKLLVNKYFKDNWDKGIYPSSHNNTITDDKLWFVSGRGENAKFGAIDLQTSEVDFIQDFPLENDGQLEKPVYHEDKLYLRETNNVLYVLE